MRTNPRRLAFVGGGPNSAAGYAHYIASRMDGVWRLEAGAFSRNAETNRAAADTYGVPPSKTHDGLDALLTHESGAIDAVVVLTPTPDHARMVEQLLRKGLPVICEKALAMTSAEARALQELCAEENGFLSVIYN